MTEDQKTTAWEAGWEVLFPAANLDELLLALVVRDLLHGASFDVEGEGEHGDMALDYLAGDELDGETYRLLVIVEAAGAKNAEVVQEITEQLLDQLVEEAESLIAQRERLDTAPASDFDFGTVPEEEERWDLVIPDWLAPDGAEVPYGFRPVRRESGEPWPSDSDLDRHGRVVVVPFGEEFHLIAIPAPTSDLEVDPSDGDLQVL